MTKPDIETIERLQAIDREMQLLSTHRLALLHPLQQLFWECTLRCNLSCRHCGSDCLKEAVAPDMPLEDFLPVLDRIKEMQPGDLPLVYPVGGEPLVREDLCTCGEEITRRGFKWGTVTNGMLLDRDKLNDMLSAGLRTISVDIDGLRDDHTWLRCHPQSYDRALEAISHLVASRGLTWDVITCVNPRNIDRLPELRKLLVEAGVKHWRCFTIFPAGRAADDAESLILKPQELRRVMDFIVETRRLGEIDLQYSCEGFLGPYEGFVRWHHYTCQAGITIASVRHDGDISGCLSIRSHYSQGNIYRDDFKDVWENRFKPFRDREWMRTGQCADCEMFRWCEGSSFHLRRDDGSLSLCHYNRLFGETDS